MALTVTLPIAFPTSCRSFSAVCGNANHSVSYGSLSSTQFSAQFYVASTGAAAGTVNGQWIAIGY